MWRVRAARPGLWLGVVFAVFAGFLAGNWQALKSRAADLSPSEKVALRFPESDPDQPIAAKAADPAPMIMGDKDFALFSPEPMIPETRRYPAPPLQPQPAEVTNSLQAEEVAPARPVPVALAVPARREAKVVTANAARSAPKAEADAPSRRGSRQPQPAEVTDSLQAEEVAPARPVPVALAVPARREAKVVTANAARSAPKAGADAPSRRGSRPGFLLNDSQIASIKSRLHLSRDQEQMWPAVEAALRNIAYAKAQSARRRVDDRPADMASLDPDSAAVQGLKSAAVPLIMSFSDEQKNEVRNLAHVMGLDKLASEF